MLVEQVSTHWNTITSFQTFFANKATKEFTTTENGSEYEFDYESVARWTKHLRWPLWRHRLILYPVNYGQYHWVLGACLSRPVKNAMVHNFYCLDSAIKYDKTNKGAKIRFMIKDHLEHEGRVKHRRFGLHEPRHVYNFERTKVPQQPNTYDCGVFTCAFAYCLAHNLPLDTFKHFNMTFFRKHIILSVSQGYIHPLISYDHSLDSQVKK